MPARPPSQAPADAILGITVAYKQDKDPRALNLGVGAYRTEVGARALGGGLGDWVGACGWTADAPAGGSAGTRPGATFPWRPIPGPTTRTALAGGQAPGAASGEGCGASAVG